MSAIDFIATRNKQGSFRQGPDAGVRCRCDSHYCYSTYWKYETSKQYTKGAARGVWTDIRHNDYILEPQERAKAKAAEFDDTVASGLGAARNRINRIIRTAAATSVIILILERRHWSVRPSSVRW